MVSKQRYRLRFLGEEEELDVYALVDMDSSKEVGTVELWIEGEEANIDYFRSRVPVTLKMKSDLLKDLKEIAPGVRFLSGFRMTGARGKASTWTTIPIEAGYKVSEGDKKKDSLVEELFERRLGEDFRQGEIRILPGGSS